MLTAQEVFEKVAIHLFTQGKRAMNGEGCAYRGSDNTRCAVGCIIPDDLYDPMLEGSSVGSLMNAEKITCHNDIEDAEGRERVFAVCDSLLAGVRELDVYEPLLFTLQKIHDADTSETNANWKTSETMRRALAMGGVAHGLDTAFLNDLSFSDR